MSKKMPSDAELSSATSIDSALVIGHSHIASIIASYQSDARQKALELSFLQLHNDQFQPALIRSKKDVVINPALAEEIRKRVEACAITAQVLKVFISLGGNQHNILGLVNHPKPFDFVLQNLDEPQPSIGAELIPYHAMRDVMEKQLQPSFQLATRLATLVPPPLAWIAPPPPIGDVDYILKHPGVFRETVTLRGVGAAPLRYKLWLLQTDLTRKWCESNGVEFIPAPTEAQNGQGFLSKRAWNHRDPTHGNEWYGSLVLEQLRTSCGTEGK